MQDQNKPFLLSSPVINTNILAQLGAALTSDDVTLLRSLGKVKKFPKNAVFVHIGDTVDQLVYLEKGLVRMVATGEDGTERTYSYNTPGTFLGDAAFFHRQPVLYDLRFEEASEILLIDRKDLPRLLERQSFVQFWLTSISLVSRTLAMQIEDAAFRTTKEKVCRVLLCLSGTEYVQYKTHFTHQEIADLVGVHRVTVTNTLQALKKEKIIHIANRGEITVVDREKLRSKIQGKIEI